MIIKVCDVNDVPFLASMNKELIEDEESDNSMSIQELEERMLGFITGYYKAFFFYNISEVIGYALVDITKNPLYLRQFLIKRENRRKGYGKNAFQELLKVLEVTVIDIEVLSWNKGGIAFWNNCGFQERSRYMRFIK